MLGGLIDEAAMLLREGVAPGATSATSAIGYRQAMSWLLGVRGVRGDVLFV